MKRVIRVLLLLLVLVLSAAFLFWPFSVLAQKRTEVAYVKCTVPSLI